MMKFKTVVLCSKLLTCLIVQKSFGNLAYKDLISSKFFISNFEVFCPEIYIRKHLKQFNT